MGILFLAAVNGHDENPVSPGLIADFLPNAETYAGFKVSLPDRHKAAFSKFEKVKLQYSGIRPAIVLDTKDLLSGTPAWDAIVSGRTSEYDPLKIKVLSIQGITADGRYEAIPLE